VELTIGKTPVRIRPAFFVVAALMGSGRADLGLLAVWIAASFVSVLFHEMGHATMGRIFGHTSSIELNERGGVTSFPGATFSPWRDIAVSLAGPFAGFLLAGAVHLATLAYDPSALGHHASTFVHDMLWCNLGWGVVNLLPIVPLDGGQVAESLLGMVRPASAKTIAYVLSLVTAGSLGAWALWQGWTFGALYAGWFAAPSVQALFRARMERGVEAALGRARDALARGDAAAAAEHAHGLFADAQGTMRRTVLMERLAREPNLEADLATALFHAGHFEASAAASEHLFERSGRADEAYNVACAFARMGRVDDGMAWLGRAESAGYTDLAHLLADEDLAALRAHPTYAELVARLGGGAPP
jgi:Zn-dependent protease